jgi:capsular polysaccharide export protein
VAENAECHHWHSWCGKFAKLDCKRRLIPVTGREHQAAGQMPRRLFHYNAGFLRDRRLRRILTLAGHTLHLGWPGQGDGVVVWGRSPFAGRGERVAARAGVPLIRVEDAFLRSVKPGRAGDAPIGLLIDDLGVHFDSATPSRLEHVLASHPLDDAGLLARAEGGMARLRAADLSKYNMHDPALAVPEAGYVLVVDQTRGDASIRHGGASDATFAQMLAAARADHPGKRIVIKTHPETSGGYRAGHFGAGDGALLTAAVSPWAVLAGAVAVYAVSSQLGWEAVLAGHRPVIFGQPWYAGWGVTDDRQPVLRRTRVLTPAQMFAAAMIVAPVWYDPCRDQLCSFETAVDHLEAQVRAFREDSAGHVAMGMRLWKRGRLQAVFGREKPLIFQDDPVRAQRLGRPLLVWAGKEPAGLTAPVVRRVEDGFLRSRGLGAELVPPLSLVTDSRGIYYDPTRTSDLEHLIAAPLPPGGRARAMALHEALVLGGLSKYNLAGGVPDLPAGKRILVPGQVEDDASIRLGAGAVRTNLGLLTAVRAANPAAVIVYKPHPDVEAGLRPGAVDTAGLADVVARGADPVALIAACDAVWTMTSLLGFEALLRGKPVTCLGAPFYAGWGLTTDLGPVPARRVARPDLAHLIHATLIAYPRYYDPISGLPCSVEVAVERLARGEMGRRGWANRVLAKGQGWLAGFAWLWR